MTIEQVAMELLGLSAKERALLAEKLLASLELEVAADTEALWAEEAARRSTQVEAGNVAVRQAGEVLSEAMARL
jgi:hypothetical protein